MPYQMHTECQGKGLYWTFQGKITADDLFTCQSQGHSLSNFDDLRYFIIDMMDVTQIEYGVEDIEKVAALDFAASKTNAHVKVALAATDENITALSYLYESETAKSPWEIRVFQNVDEARAWVEQEPSLKQVAQNHY